MNDSELVRAIQAGDREAFGLLVDRYRGLVYGLCYRLAGSRRDADELAHDAFVEAYLNIGTLRDPAALPGWLRTLTLNLCRMWFRRCERCWTELPEDVPAGQQAEEKDDPSLLARMAGGLSLLPAPQRLILVLHYFDGLSYDQLAEFLEVPAGTVMSRLYRARVALRRILEGPVPEEEIPMIEDDRFKQEVQAEIALLLEMFRSDPSAAERLAVILRHSPQRLLQLIQHADSEDALHNLAILLPRLGPAGITAVLDAAFSEDPGPSSRATAVLGEMVRRCGSTDTGGWQPGTPCPTIYLFLQALIDHPAPPAAKAELLLELLEACEDDAVAAILSCALLSYPQPAIELLLQWFRTVTSPAELHASPYLLFALCRTGTCFCRELLNLLGKDDAPGQLLTLDGLEAVGRCLDNRWMTDFTPDQAASEVRTRAKWPPLQSEDLDGEVLAQTQALTAKLLASPRTDLRNGALAVLGYLKARAYLPQMSRCVTHEDPTTRLAAIRALAEIGDADAARPLMQAAEQGQPAERRAAVEALGRRQVRHAQFLLMRLLGDADPQVQQAAVTALGQLGTDQAAAALRDLLTSSDRRLQKAAAKALYRPARERVESRPSPTLVPVSARLREGASPRAYSAVHLVLRCALPALRPYDEQELTRRIAAVCIDYSLTRRRLVDEGWMTRDTGRYELTDLGIAAWNVEQFILAHYLK